MVKTTGAAPHRRERFLLLLIKPSHYDDDGYVIQWLRTGVPSNTLAALYGIATDCIERALGDNVDIRSSSRRDKHPSYKSSCAPPRAAAAGWWRWSAMLQPVSACGRSRVRCAGEDPRLHGGFHAAGVRHVARNAAELREAWRWAFRSSPARQAGWMNCCPCL
jgi:hypothetical protein